jgi:hypothetical protein
MQYGDTLDEQRLVLTIIALLCRSFGLSTTKYISELRMFRVSSSSTSSSPGDGNGGGLAIPTHDDIVGGCVDVTALKTIFTADHTQIDEAVKQLDRRYRDDKRALNTDKREKYKGAKVAKQERLTTALDERKTRVFAILDAGSDETKTHNDLLVEYGDAYTVLIRGKNTDLVAMWVASKTTTTVTVENDDQKQSNPSSSSSPWTTNIVLRCITAKKATGSITTFDESVYNTVDDVSTGPIADQSVYDRLIAYQRSPASIPSQKATLGTFEQRLALFSQQQWSKKSSLVKKTIGVVVKAVVDVPVYIVQGIVHHILTTSTITTTNDTSSSSESSSSESSSLRQRYGINCYNFHGKMARTGTSNGVLFSRKFSSQQCTDNSGNALATMYGTIHSSIRSSPSPTESTTMCTPVPLPTLRTNNRYSSNARDSDYSHVMVVMTIILAKTKRLVDDHRADTTQAVAVAYIQSIASQLERCFRCSDVFFGVFRGIVTKGDVYGRLIRATITPLLLSSSGLSNRRITTVDAFNSVVGVALRSNISLIDRECNSAERRAAFDTLCDPVVTGFDNDRHICAGLAFERARRSTSTPPTSRWSFVDVDSTRVTSTSKVTWSNHRNGVITHPIDEE